MNDFRNALKRNTIIQLYSDTYTTEGSKYLINSVVGRGGSSICYDVERISDHKRGKLKELYPISYGELKRDLGNHLIYNDCHDIVKHRLNFISAYNTLKQNNKTGAINNFIPDWDVLYSDNTGLGTPYVWMPNPEYGIRFDEYINNIKKKDATLLDVKNIIECISTLTQNIEILHSIGILHLDIKPSNFLILSTINQQYNTSSISLFDVNSIYSPISGTEYISSLGTLGFAAPELIRQKRNLTVSESTDIYSIGATLFYALTGKKYASLSDGPHKREDDREGKYICGYSYISSEINICSILNRFRYSINQDIFNKIINILKHCLNKAIGLRYQKCNELNKELREIIQILNKQIIDDNNPPQLIQGRYEILSVQGHSYGGDTSKIFYLAKDVYTNVPISIEQVKFINNNFDVQNFISRVEIERNLSHHALLNIRDIVAFDSTIYIVRPYAAVEDLDDFIRKNKCDYNMKLKLAKELCEILIYLASLSPQIVILSLSPQYIYVTSDIHIKLFDFSNPNVINQNIISISYNWQENYRPPEVWVKDLIDIRTNIYMFGEILYFIFTGLHRYSGVKDSEYDYNLEKLNEGNYISNKKLKNIIEKCTQYDPNDRYQNPKELMYDLEHIDDLPSKKCMFRRRKAPPKL